MFQNSSKERHGKELANTAVLAGGGWGAGNGGKKPVLETPKNVFKVSKRQRYYIFNSIISKTLSGDGINLPKSSAFWGAEVGIDTDKSVKCPTPTDLIPDLRSKEVKDRTFFLNRRQRSCPLRQSLLIVVDRCRSRCLGIEFYTFNVKKHRAILSIVVDHNL